MKKQTLLRLIAVLVLAAMMVAALASCFGNNDVDDDAKDNQSQTDGKTNNQGNDQGDNQGNNQGTPADDDPTVDPGNDPTVNPGDDPTVDPGNDPVVIEIPEIDLIRLLPKNVFLTLTLSGARFVYQRVIYPEYDEDEPEIVGDDVIGDDFEDDFGDDYGDVNDDVIEDDFGDVNDDVEDDFGDDDDYPDPTDVSYEYVTYEAILGEDTRVILGVDDNDEIYFLLYAVISIGEVDSEDEPAVIYYRGYAKDNVVYLQADASYTICDVQYLLDMANEAINEYLAMIVEEIPTDLIESAVSGMTKAEIDVNEEAVNAAAEFVAAFALSFFSSEEQDDGSVVYTLDYDAILAFNEDLMTLTIADFMNKYIDENAYNYFKLGVTALRGVTVEDVLGLLKEAGVTEEDMLAAYAEITEALAEEGVTLDFDLALLLATPSFRSAKVVDLIAAAAEIDPEVIDAYIQLGFLAMENSSVYNLISVIALMAETDEEEEAIAEDADDNSDDGVEENVEDTEENVEENVEDTEENVEDTEEDDTPLGDKIYEAVKTFATMLKGYVTPSFRTKGGKLLSVSLALNEVEIPFLAQVNGTLTVSCTNEKEETPDWAEDLIAAATALDLSKIEDFVVSEDNSVEFESFEDDEKYTITDTYDESIDFIIVEGKIVALSAASLSFRDNPKYWCGYDEENDKFLTCDEKNISEEETVLSLIFATEVSAAEEGFYAVTLTGIGSRYRSDLTLVKFDGDDTVYVSEWDYETYEEKLIPYTEDYDAGESFNGITSYTFYWNPETETVLSERAYSNMLYNQASESEEPVEIFED